ncbi:arsenate reductase [Ligilactobacillus acidipiscis DSM 15836]|uniref:Arsenate reductase n=1 Tax=Ligilactobacillus acidipiscis DSM 15836 TaxID=1423716 RepID=A0ABR5PJZ1_9LACO|nr:arsenate reductase family protein [Ligilactobacillus acidipiscis]KRM27810.1 arsenate reductase [Ligilactobacillus acidipiscis DSM 15836]GAW63430.1 arsenate reductase [Ligilactobacillus acidipiscis]GEN19638.1 arsenate reductase [Ligilactobacillus acidipiscis]
MKMFYCYSKCSTCKKAKKWLDEHNVQYNSQDLVVQPPAKEDLLKWLNNSSQPLRYFFNTSGQHYRQQNLKDKLPRMTNEEAAKLLSADGKLIKRPLMVDGDKLTCGFKEEVYAEKCSH